MTPESPEGRDMTWEEIDAALDMMVSHMKEVAEGPFLVEGALQALEYKLKELYNAVRLNGTVTEELVKKAKKHGNETPPESERQREDPEIQSLKAEIARLKKHVNIGKGIE